MNNEKKNIMQVAEAIAQGADPSLTIDEIACDLEMAELDDERLLYVYMRVANYCGVFDSESLAKLIKEAKGG